jgi:hypothetical protein
MTKFTLYDIVIASTTGKVELGVVENLMDATGGKWGEWEIVVVTARRKYEK